MKVALIGSHGVGKTTLSFELAALLKRRNVDVEVVRETARRCPLPINQDTTAAAQLWILHTQIADEIEATARHDTVVCDRSALDNYCYFVHSSGTDPAIERLLDRWMSSYQLLVHVPILNPPTFDGVRAVDPVFQQQIELLLDGMIAARGLLPLRLAPDRRDRWAHDVLDRMLPEIEPTLPLFGTDDGQTI